MIVVTAGGHRLFENDPETVQVVSEMLSDLLSRAARYTGGVWVGKFFKTCTYQRMTPIASREVGAVTERQCNVERMLAHAIAARARVRIERVNGS